MIDISGWSKLAGVAGAGLGALFMLVKLPGLFSLIGAFALVALAVWYAEHTTMTHIIPRERGILITGCDTGFGHELAHHLDSLGLTVFAGCLKPDGKGAHTLRDNCTHRLHVIPLDVTSDEQVQAARSYIEEHLPQGGLWGVVNNAGAEYRGEIEISTMEHFRKVYDINTLGMVRVTKACLPLLRKSQGRIVNVSSAKGILPIHVCGAYTMSKWAIEAFNNILRLEAKRWGIKVICIQPCNYGATTNNLNESGQFKEMEASMSDEVRQLYGNGYVQQYADNVAMSADSSSPSVFPVIEAMTDALLLLTPKTHYLIGGGRGLFDSAKVACLIYPYLPTSLQDRLIMYVFGPFPELKSPITPEE